MTRRVHTVPIEAVRYAVTADGARTLATLAAARAEFQPDAIVELGDDGWVATLVYSVPGFARRMKHAHVCVAWAPAESAGART